MLEADSTVAKEEVVVDSLEKIQLQASGDRTFIKKGGRGHGAVCEPLLLI